MSVKKNLLLITLSFPFDIGGEDTFLKNEVTFYEQFFDKIYLLPGIKSQIKTIIDPNINLDHSLIDFKEGKTKLKPLLGMIVAFSSLFFNEFYTSIKKTITFRGFRKLCSSYILICNYLRFFEYYFQNAEKKDWIIYTYWFTPVTTAAALYSAKHKNIKVVTRAHGIDLYEFRNEGYIPFRRKSIALISKYFFVSDFGKSYTQNLYPQYYHKLEVYPLAVPDSKVCSMTTQQGCLSIVSCSSVDSNKRVNLILEAIRELGFSHKELKIKWDHFGAGPLLEEIESSAKNMSSGNVKYSFHGFVKNESIIRFYNENEVDVFITTTASEGGRPVSLMEALCCSIPVVATRVGGIPEIVNDSNGILLNKNPTISEIWEALKWFSENKKEAFLKRRPAREIWEQKCNPEKNFSSFVKYLATI